MSTTNTANDPCQCVTLKTLVRRASRLLNDDIEDKDTVRWPFATLVDYLNEGAAHIQSLRPDAFTADVTLEVTDVCPQRIPAIYDSLVSINKVIEKGPGGRVSVVNDVIEEDNALSKYVAPVCVTGENASAGGCLPKSVAPKIASYSKASSKSPTDFYVTPAIPHGKSVTVMATVVKKAPCFCADMPDTCIELPTKLHAALIDWMLYRAYSMDIESEFSYRMSTRYEASFYRFINNGYLQEARFGSGYFNGEKGDGDENATPRSTGIR